MKKNAIDFVIRASDEKGKISNNVTINNFIEKFDNLTLQIQYFQEKLFFIDFKFMNSIKTTIKFHLAGILDLLKENNNIYSANLLDNVTFQNKVYGLHTELLKLIDVTICDLKSGCEYIDLISLNNTIKCICELHYFAKNINSNDLTFTQEIIIENKLFELIDLYNTKVSSQISCIINNNKWLVAINAYNPYNYLQICNILNSNNYELDVLRTCTINYSISNEYFNDDILFLK